MTKPTNSDSIFLRAGTQRGPVVSDANVNVLLRMMLVFCFFLLFPTQKV